MFADMLYFVVGILGIVAAVILSKTTTDSTSFYLSITCISILTFSIICVLITFSRINPELLIAITQSPNSEKFVIELDKLDPEPLHTAEIIINEYRDSGGLTTSSGEDKVQALGRKSELFDKLTTLSLAVGISILFLVFLLSF
jgi:hypothetical protein